MRSLRAWVALLVVAALLGALAARLASRKPLRSDDAWPDDDQAQADVTTATDRLAGRAGPHGRPSSRSGETSAWQRLVAPQTLPDSVFKPRTGSGRILHQQIHSAISSGRVEFRDLNRREGSFLPDKNGWSRFDGSRFVPVGESDLPEDLKDRPSPDLAEPAGQPPSPGTEAR